MGPLVAVGGRLENPRRTRRLWTHLLILVLLVGVAGLSTVAKDSLYHFHSISAQHVTSAVKMQLAHTQVMDSEPAMPVSLTLPARPEYHRRHWESSKVIFIPSVGITVSLQHRSPPSNLS